MKKGDFVYAKNDAKKLGYIKSVAPTMVFIDDGLTNTGVLAKFKTDIEPITCLYYDFTNTKEYQFKPGDEVTNYSTFWYSRMVGTILKVDRIEDDVYYLVKIGPNDTRVFPQQALYPSTYDAWDYM